MRPAWLALLVFLTIVRAASAQYRIDSWTTEHGLPQSTVFQIGQTPDGFLWATTFGGLARFDGRSFRVFDTTTNPELPSSRLAGLRVDGDGRLWILTQNRDLLELRADKFIRYTTADGLPMNAVAGTPWIERGRFVAPTSKGNVIWEKGRFVPFASPGPPGLGKEATIAQMFDTGVLWYRDEKGVHRFEPGHSTTDVTLPFDGGLHEDRRGRVWMRRNGHLVRIEHGQVSEHGPEDGVPAINSLTIFDDPDGTVWFCEDAGLVRYRDGRFSHYTVADGLPSNNVTFVFRDREGTHWVGTQGGLARLTDRPITTFGVSEGLAADNTYPILQDRRGDIWIGGWDGLTRYRNGVFESVGPSLGLVQPRLTALFEDRGGTLWIGGYGGGIHQIKDGRHTLLPTSAGAPAVTFVIYQGRGPEVWLGAAGGLFRYLDGVFTLVNSESGVVNGGEVHALHEDRHGVLWVGNAGGLGRLDRGVLTQFPESSGFTGRGVRALREDSDGALWIGTYDTGLFRYRDGRFTRYTTREGLPSNGAFQILEDGQARLWISSNTGIYRVSKAELNDLAAGVRKAVAAVPYGRKDGMRNQECNGLGAPAGIRASDGRLWFPTQAGVAVIDPSSVVVNRVPPPIAFLDVLVADRPTSVRDRIEIRSGPTSIEAHFAALTFVRPELTRYRYRMEGLDPDWVEAGHDNVVRYGRLPYGTFRLRVTGSNRDGIWNEEGASVAIVVVRPFYRTTWFGALVIVLLASGGVGVHRWRLGLLERQRQLQETFSRRLIDSQESDRQRIAGGLHDGLSQNLIVIKTWAAVVERRLPADHADRSRLADIGGAAARALSEVRDVVHDLVPYHLDQLGLADTLRDMATRIAEVAGLEVVCTLVDVDGQLSKTAQTSLYRIVQEALNNIAKHAQATHAWIDMTVDERAIRVTVRDDGRGFSPGDSPLPKTGGFGLFGMAERARMMGGHMTVDAAAGRGTTLSIEIPIASREAGTV